ncbi:hypothetical protein EDB83DRAFT_2516386 [Lactarius deliciosus]|nr:hypothetical protein EDB83DRAFT_2516386 [Lactarius deliciosus]
MFHAGVAQTCAIPTAYSWLDDLGLDSLLFRTYSGASLASPLIPTVRGAGPVHEATGFQATQDDVNRQSNAPSRECTISSSSASHATSIVLVLTSSLPSNPTIIQDILTLRDAGPALMAYFYFDFRDLDKQHRRNSQPPPFSPHPTF